MANFNIPENPKYSDEIRMFETNDPGHADVFNTVIEQLVLNDAFEKKQMDSMNEDLKEKQTPSGDAKDNTVTFDSGDAENPTSWTDVSIMASGEKHKSLFGKISTMFKNVRYLYKLLGITDISQIGDGTITNAIKTLKKEQPSDATQSASGLMTAVDKKKLDGIAEKANNYTHPSTHAASMITQDATHRFASDSEKAAWNNKLNKSDVTQSVAVTVAGQKALDAIEKNASIEGTLAHGISQLNSNITNIIKYDGPTNDLNDYVDEGRYTIGNFSGFANVPAEAAAIGFGLLVVFESTVYGCQVLISKDYIGYRFYFGTYWWEWSKL